jgi:serine/threonine-protein kinase RsbW
MARVDWAWTAHFSIPSSTDATSGAIERLLEYLQQAEWPSRDVFGVHLALEEALVNAIQHGNGDDQAKSVHVVYQVTPQRLRIEITDEGAGFRPADVADPTCGEKLCEPHGRGLLLMRHYMSKVEYVGCGNKLILEKRRSREHAA